MAADPLTIPAESLLRHRAFVRALARSLVRDEHAAEDLVQETWLTALKRPPRSAGALPAWLARVVRTRAQNAARGEARRVTREAAAAREEADESEERLREHLAMQQKVVQAVLELKEPYRSVVLLRYYEGLSPSGIAARRGVAKGTVRAQVSRAHDLLRERLDADFGGSRKAWSTGLLLLLGKHETVLSGAKIGIAAGLLAAMVVVPVAWRGFTAKTSAPSSEPALVAAEPPPPAKAVALDARPESETPPPVRSAIALPQAAVSAPPTDADLAALSIDDSLVLARQVQLQLQNRLLVPDTNAPEIRAALEREPGLQLARILPYGRLEGDIDGRFLGIRGAGAYFSFVTRSNSYDRQPDIHFDGTCSTSSYGGTAGFIVDIGEVALKDVPDSHARVLATAGSTNLSPAVWDLLWMDAKTMGREFDHSIEDRAVDLDPNRFRFADAVMNHTYLVRRILPGEHDMLAAFRILSKDEYGYTFAWRLLYSWPVPEGRGGARQADVVPPPAPSWLEALDVPGLMELSHRIRATSEPKLFPPRPDLEEKYRSIFGGSEAGIARMLHRGRYDAILEGRERGAFYTFATRSGVYDGEDDLQFDHESIHPTYGRGFLMDLGKVEIEAVARAGENGLPQFNDKTLETWKLLWTLRHVELLPGETPRALTVEDEQRVRTSPVATAVLGHTYLLRSIVPEKHDLLVAFSVLDKDEHGIWLGWRQLRSW